MNEAITYLIEIRKRLLSTLIFFLGCFLVCYWKIDFLIEYMVPIYGMKNMITTQLPQAILAPINFSLFLSLLLTMPWLIFQVFQFIMPALYPDEKKSLWAISIMGSVLFYLGILMSIWVFVPWIFYSILSWSEGGIRVLPDASYTLSMISRLHLVFGFVFEFPLLMGVLAFYNWIDEAQVNAARPYIVIACFIIGMLLTPPDVVSQVLVAVPMWLFFEVGTRIGFYLKNRA